LALVGCRFGDRFAATATPLAIAEGEIPAPGNYELSIVNGADSRDVIVHLPPGYDGSADLPLVIVLHGGAGSAAHIQRHSQMDADADNYGFVVAYPDGSGRLQNGAFTWNAGHCCGYALETNSDDVGILNALIDAMLSHYTIDPARVYIAGISNGAMMAYRAGAELADKVAAIAPIAGSIGGQVNAESPVIFPDTPSSPVAVIAFHGKQDQHVLYDGGLSPMAIQDGRIDLSVDSSVSFWVKANGCDPVPASQTQSDGNIVIETYSSCQGGADVILVTIVDGGHAWPGARERLVGDDPTQDISANQMMLEFFLAHPKQN
jgi:polyhydroxybutyrate depolymerase